MAKSPANEAVFKAAVERPLADLLADFEKISKGRSALPIEQVRQNLVETSWGLKQAFLGASAAPDSEIARPICEHVLGFLNKLDPANEGDALDEAVLKVADRIERDSKNWLPEYHNAAHYFDTALSTVVLALTDYATNLQTRMTPLGIKLLFLAGLGHDLGHLGASNGKDFRGKPAYFKFEDTSYAILSREIKDLGLARQMQVIKQLYRATSPDGGTQIAHEALLYHMSGKDPALAKTFTDRVAALESTAMSDLQDHLFHDEKMTTYAEFLNKGGVLPMAIEPELATDNARRLHDEFARAVREGHIEASEKQIFVDEASRKILPEKYKDIAENGVRGFQQPSIALVLEHPFQHTFTTLVDGKEAYPNPSIPGLKPSALTLQTRGTSVNTAPNGIRKICRLG